MSIIPKESSSLRACIVLPSLKVSGGVMEGLRLARDLKPSLDHVSVLAMWRSERSVTDEDVECSSLSSWKTGLVLALPQLFGMMVLFWLHTRKHRKTAWIFTHYATLPLALLVPRRQRFVFVQGLEWEFIRRSWLSSALKNIIFYVYRRSTLIAANPYLFQALQQQGLSPQGQAPIWADPVFGSGFATERDIDVLMILRKGDTKRLDLYMEALDHFKNVAPSLRLEAVTTEDEIQPLVHDLVNVCHIRPNREAIHRLYARSKVFLLLSEHEGFALPPLEAMGSGCVPICRDAGGPRAYMSGALMQGLVPLDKDIKTICQQVISLLQNPVELEILSKAAVDIFHQGLVRTQSDRMSLGEVFFTANGGVEQ
jgi:glycosyltransferase involved in cell wall biosynthesis